MARPILHHCRHRDVPCDSERVGFLYLARTRNGLQLQTSYVFKNGPSRQELDAAKIKQIFQVLRQ